MVTEAAILWRFHQRIIGGNARGNLHQKDGKSSRSGYIWVFCIAMSTSESNTHFVFGLFGVYSVCLLISGET